MKHLNEHIYLSEKDKKIAGVCGGLGEYFEIDPTLIRLAWAVVTALTGLLPGIIAYIAAAIIMPKRSGVEV